MRIYLGLGSILVIVVIIGIAFSTIPAMTNAEAESNIELKKAIDDCVKVSLSVQPDGELQKKSEVVVKIFNGCKKETYFNRYNAPRFHIERKEFNETKFNRTRSKFGDIFMGLPKDIAWSDVESRKRFVVPSKGTKEFRLRFSKILWLSPKSSIISWGPYKKVLEEDEYVLFASAWGGKKVALGKPKEGVRGFSEKIEFSYPFNKKK